MFKFEGSQDQPLEEAVKQKQIGGNHYKGTNIQAIDVIQDWDLPFELGSVVKYIARLGKKDAPSVEIDKAIHYLELYKQRFKLND